MRQRMKRALRLAGGLAVVAILGYAMWSDSTWDDVPDHLLRFDRAIEQCAENQACMDADYHAGSIRVAHSEVADARSQRTTCCKLP